MKTKLLLMITFFCCVASATIAQKAEEDAIKKVIYQETRSDLERNYDKWAETWAHDSTVFLTYSGAWGHYEAFGWDKISVQMKETIKNMDVSDEQSMAPFLDKFDYHFTINGNM